MNKIKVLLVEDEVDLAMIIQDTLNNESFDVCVARNGAEGLELLASFKPDVVVADIMMPVMDGFNMVSRLRRSDQVTPVLFLTARSAINDIVEGFELGGNDYLKKPFSMLELMVRIKALVRRTSLLSSASPSPEDSLSIGSYMLSLTRQILSLGNHSDELSHREAEILRMLATNRGCVVSSKEILLSLWGDDSPYNAKSLHVFITRLRHYLSDDSSIRIINVRGVGYKMTF